MLKKFHALYESLMTEKQYDHWTMTVIEDFEQAKSACEGGKWCIATSKDLFDHYKPYVLVKNVKTGKMFLLSKTDPEKGDTIKCTDENDKICGEKQFRNSVPPALVTKVEEVLKNSSQIEIITTFDDAQKYKNKNYTWDFAHLETSFDEYKPIIVIKDRSSKKSYAMTISPNGGKMCTDEADRHIDCDTAIKHLSKSDKEKIKSVLDTHPNKDKNK